MSILVVMTYLIIFCALYFSYFFMERKDYTKDKKPAEKIGRSFKFIYFYIQISSLVFGIGSLLYSSPLLLKFYEPDQGLQTFGLIVSILGCIVFFLAIAELGDSYSPCDDQYLPNKIVTTGIYRWVKHPIYIGTATVILGLAFATCSLLIWFNVLLTLFFQIRSAKKEEKELSEQFSEYYSYKKSREERT